MWIVAGHTGEFTPPAMLGRIGFTRQRVPFAATQSRDMDSCGDLLVAGETKLIDRLMQLGRIVTAMGVMTDFTHPGGNRTMEEFEPLQLLLLFLVTFKAEFRFSLRRPVQGSSLQRVTVGTGIGADRSMNILLVCHPFMAGEAGIVLVRHIDYLFHGRAHIVTRDTERIGFRAMHDRLPELLGDINRFPSGRVEDVRRETLQFLVAIEGFHRQLIFTLVP